MFIILWGVTKKDWDHKQEVKSEWGLFHFWSLIGVATKMQTRRFLFSRKTGKRGTCLMVKGYWQSVFLRCRVEMMKYVHIFCVILLIIWVRDKECETHDLTKHHITHDVHPQTTREEHTVSSGVFQPTIISSKTWIRGESSTSFCPVRSKYYLA